MGNTCSGDQKTGGDLHGFTNFNLNSGMNLEQKHPSEHYPNHLKGRNIEDYLSQLSPTTQAVLAKLPAFVYD